MSERRWLRGSALAATTLTVVLGLSGCRPGNAIEGAPVAKTSVAQEPLRQAMEQKLNEVGRHMAAVVGCIIADKNSGTRNLGDSYLSNWDQFIGPDDRIGTPDDGNQHLSVTALRNENLQNFTGTWTADWYGPPAPDGSITEPVSVYVSGSVPLESELGLNVRLPDGSRGMGPRQVQAGALEVEPQVLIFRSSLGGATIHIEKRRDAIYHRPSLGSLLPLDAATMGQFGTEAVMAAGHLLAESKVDPANCELH